jgi:hypothetical protein
MQKKRLNFYSAELPVTRPNFSMTMKNLARGLYRQSRAQKLTPTCAYCPWISVQSKRDIFRSLISLFTLSRYLYKAELAQTAIGVKRKRKEKQKTRKGF